MLSSPGLRSLLAQHLRAQRRRWCVLAAHCSTGVGPVGFPEPPLASGRDAGGAGAPSGTTVLPSAAGVDAVSAEVVLHTNHFLDRVELTMTGKQRAQIVHVILEGGADSAKMQGSQLRWVVGATWGQGPPRNPRCAATTTGHRCPVRLFTNVSPLCVHVWRFFMPLAIRKKVLQCFRRVLRHYNPALDENVHWLAGNFEELHAKVDLKEKDYSYQARVSTAAAVVSDADVAMLVRARQLCVPQDRMAPEQVEADARRLALLLAALSPRDAFRRRLFKSLDRLTHTPELLTGAGSCGYGGDGVSSEMCVCWRPCWLDTAVCSCSHTPCGGCVCGAAALLLSRPLASPGSHCTSPWC
jgi:hypothetical protein